MLFSIQGLPVFQNKMFNDRAAAVNCPRGDVRLVQDMKTGLIFNESFDPGLLKYDADYQNEQACSEVFLHHLEEVKAIIERYFRGRSLIEVGCGKGFFLEYLSRAGFEVTGIDPAYEGNNTRVIKSRFEAGLGLAAEGIILLHVLEHISDPHAMLTTIAQANGGSGTIYLEVPCFDWVCRRKAWFDIFYEHVNYFRVTDFSRLFGKVYECGHFFGGQYFYVVADLATLRSPVADQDDRFAFPRDFLAGIDRCAAIARKGRTAIWGGASKGVLFALHLQREGAHVEIVIDINPAKQNRYMACTGLKIVSPAEGLDKLQTGDDIFIMNSNYLPEIIAQSNSRYNYIKVD